MRISDWSSDVCSSDLVSIRHRPEQYRFRGGLLRCNTSRPPPHPLSRPEMPDFGDRIRKRRMHHPAGAAHTAGHRCDEERTGLHAGGAMFRAALFMLLITLAGGGPYGPAHPGEPARETPVPAAMALTPGVRQATAAAGPAPDPPTPTPAAAAA